MNNKLTIIVQAYNPTEKSIMQTILSLEKQIDKNFDVLFFDNCSNNGWEEILPIVKPKFDYKFARSNINNGPGQGRNDSIKFLKNDFVARVDDGDCVSSNYSFEINKKIMEGHDAIFIPSNFKKKEILTSAPMYAVLKKDLIEEYPTWPDFLTEDSISNLYFIFKSKSPVIVDIKYFAELNSRWGDDKKRLADVKGGQKTLFYWLDKIQDDWVSGMEFRMSDLIKVNSSTIFSDIKLKIRSNVAINELRKTFELAPRNDFKWIISLYKFFRYKTFNPKHKIWPAVLYRFFKR